MDFLVYTTPSVMVHQYGFLEPIELHSRLVIAPRTLTVNDTTGSGGGDMCYQKQTKSTLLSIYLSELVLFQK